MYEMYIEGNVPSSKNSKRIVRSRSGTPLLIDSSITADYRKTYLPLYLAHKAGFGAFMRSAAIPVTLSMFFVRDSKRRFDYHNVSQIITDIMVSLSMIPDDSMQYIIPRYMGYKVDPEDPGVLVIASDACEDDVFRCSSRYDVLQSFKRLGKCTSNQPQSSLA